MDDGGWVSFQRRPSFTLLIIIHFVRFSPSFFDHLIRCKMAENQNVAKEDSLFSGSDSDSEGEVEARRGLTENC